MKKFRQRLATALIVSMMAGATMVPAYAEEPVKKGWYLEADGWYFYKGNGEMATGEIRKVHEKWYGFDETGRMFSDERFSDPDAIPEQEDGEEPFLDLYAHPDGHLATDGWVRLDDNGSLYDRYEDSGSGNWYYFKKNEKGYGVMVRGVELTLNQGQDKGKTYAFHEDGRMYSQEWAYVSKDGTKTTVPLDEHDDSELELSDKPSYYHYLGDRAEGKWLPLEDGYWYEFNDAGEGIYARERASASNASEPVGGIWDDTLATGSNISPRPALEAESVQFAGAENAENYDPDDLEVTVTVGEEVSLKFLVPLASDSNAKAPDDGKWFKRSRHDIWCEVSEGTNFKLEIGTETPGKTGYCKVTYTPTLVREREIQLYVDGIPSEPITVIPTLATVEAQKSAAETVLDSWEETGSQPTQVKEDIKQIYAAAETEEQKKTLQETLLNNKNFESLSSSYATANRIAEAVSVAEEAEASLGGTVRLTGGALNAEEESEVELKVGTAEAPALKEDFLHKIAFDITLHIDGDETSELEIPVKITIPVPVGYSANSIRLFRIHGGEESEIKFVDNGDNTISFMTDRFSTYVFSQNEALQEEGGENNPGDGSGGGSGGSGSGGSSSGQSAGVVTTDAKKGKINSVTGIITGSGSGYSDWQQETAADGSVIWKLRYADGTCAAGTMVTREDGTTYEQPLWELINGAWYAFGADGCAKSGFLYDENLGGYFYIDINTGMKTGWCLIGGSWYYFNPVSDGRRGIMMTDTTIDGYYVDKNGIWKEEQ